MKVDTVEIPTTVLSSVETLDELQESEVRARKRELCARAGQEHKTKIINELVERFGYPFQRARSCATRFPSAWMGQSQRKEAPPRNGNEGGRTASGPGFIRFQSQGNWGNTIIESTGVPSARSLHNTHF